MILSLILNFLWLFSFGLLLGSLYTNKHPFLYSEQLATFWEVLLNTITIYRITQDMISGKIKGLISLLYCQIFYVFVYLMFSNEIKYTFKNASFGDCYLTLHTINICSTSPLIWSLAIFILINFFESCFTMKYIAMIYVKVYFYWI